MMPGLEHYVEINSAHADGWSSLLGLHTLEPLLSPSSTLEEIFRACVISPNFLELVSKVPETSKKYLNLKMAENLKHTPSWGYYLLSS